ncbi:uncharacterized protein METZ01_LOCUS133204 [marine metagenome]|uniref:Uncharacterized protein n=1 Tax=marine metagenome TaxID=408172 RepID=A0A381YTS7_9ZZZZ
MSAFVEKACNRSRANAFGAASYENPFIG